MTDPAYPTGNGKVSETFKRKFYHSTHTHATAIPERGSDGQASDIPEGDRVSAAALEPRLRRASSKDNGCGQPATAKQERVNPTPGRRRIRLGLRQQAARRFRVPALSRLRELRQDWPHLPLVPRAGGWLTSPWACTSGRPGGGDYWAGLVTQRAGPERGRRRG